MTATEQTTLEGSIVACVARDGARTATNKQGMSFPLWIVATYQAVRRIDGILTWRRIGSIGASVSGRAPSGKLKAACAAYAADNGIPVLSVRHGLICE